MSDIFREVDEDVRHENAMRLWDKYSVFVYGLAFLIILGTAVWRGYDYWQTKQAEAAGAQYETALQLFKTGKADEGQAALVKLQSTGPSGYVVLAKFQIAAKLGAKDAAAGAKAYDALAEDASIDPVLRDVARIQSVYLSVDRLSPADVQQRLSPMAQGTGAFRHSARELLGLSALKAKDYENAGRWFDEIVADSTTPEGIRSRAEAFIGLVQSSRPAQKSGG